MIAPGLFIFVLAIGIIPYFTAWALLSYLTPLPTRTAAGAHYLMFSLFLWGIAELLLRNF